VHDQRLIRAHQAVLDMIYYHRNTQMCWAAQAIFDISASEGKENLVGTVFHTQEERDHYFPYLMRFLGDLSEEDVEEDSSDLEDLTDLFAQTCPRLPSPQPDDLDDEEGSGGSSSEA